MKSEGLRNDLSGGIRVSSIATFFGVVILLGSILFMLYNNDVFNMPWEYNASELMSDGGLFGNVNGVPSVWAEGNSSYDSLSPGDSFTFRDSPYDTPVYQASATPDIPYSDVTIIRFGTYYTNIQFIFRGNVASKYSTDDILYFTLHISQNGSYERIQEYMQGAVPEPSIIHKWLPVWARILSFVAGILLAIIILNTGTRSTRVLFDLSGWRARRAAKKAQKEEEMRQYQNSVPGMYKAGMELTKEGNRLMENSHYVEAKGRYHEALRKLKSAKELALNAGDSEMARNCETGIGNLMKYIEDCDLAIDSQNLEDFTRGSEEKFRKAVEAMKRNDLIPAKNMLTQALNDVSEAQNLAMKRNFSTAIAELSSHASEIRDAMGTVDRLIQQKSLGISNEKVLGEYMAELNRRQALLQEQGKRPIIVVQGDMVNQKNVDQSVTVRDSVIQRSHIGTPASGSSQDVQDSVIIGKYDDAEPAVTPPPPPPDSTPNIDPHDLYEKALRQALSDGALTASEKKYLEKLRKKYGITIDEHNMAEAMIKLELGRK
ncbi:MAG: hypothetical protein QW728_04990 [Thermoplasmata archaeon]